jgi:hypothetical protein
VKLWNFEFVYQNRKTGPTHHIVSRKGSLPVALGRATRAFYRDRTTKDRFDIKIAGLKVQVLYLREATEGDE